MDADKIKKILSKPWASDGLDFSRRVWGQHRAELVQRLNTDFVQALIRGDDSQKLIDKISSDFNIAKYKAGRLVMTESAFFASESQKDAFKELGVKYFSVSATFDRDTCSDCGYREGEKIPMDLYEVGVTAPPFHPNCRCDIVPEDAYGDIKSYRAARDKGGNYVEIPNDMSYMQWKKKFVDEKTDILKKNTGSSRIKAIDNEEVIALHTVGKLDKDIYSCISKDIKTDEVIITDERIKHIKERHPNDYEQFRSYIPEIIKDPDYILESKKPNTGFLLKQISVDNNKFQLILRIKSEEENDTLKNSVITFLKISERKWNKYLRNKKIIYKKE